MQLTTRPGDEAAAERLADVDIVADWGFDKVYGGPGTDTLYFVNTTHMVYLNGGEDTDFISGGSAGDIIYGGSETDWIHGHGGADTIAGETGNDTIYGGSGNDTVAGNDGNDYIYGGSDAGGRICSPSGGGDRRERTTCGDRGQGSNLDASMFSPVASTRSSWASLPALTGQAAILRASASSALRWKENAWSCCMSWFPTPPCWLCS